MCLLSLLFKLKLPSVSLNSFPFLKSEKHFLIHKNVFKNFMYYISSMHTVHAAYVVHAFYIVNFSETGNTPYIDNVKKRMLRQIWRTHYNYWWEDWYTGYWLAMIWRDWNKVASAVRETSVSRRNGCRIKGLLWTLQYDSALMV